jgi:hypothetical protein
MKTAVHLSAFSISLMGVTFLSSSHLGFQAILQPPLSTWPMPYLTAECFLFSGIAFFTLFSRTALSKIIGIVIFLLAFQRTGELLFQPDSRAYSIFNTIHFDLSNSSKMVLPAAIGFMLIGTMFVFWPSKQLRLNNVVIYFVSSLIVFLGAVGVFTSLLSSQRTLHLQGMLIHFYTAVGFLVVGFGFIFAKFQKKIFDLPNRPSFFKKLRL